MIRLLKLIQIPAPRLRKLFFLRLELFSTGAVQIFFVSVNTYFLAQELVLGVFFAAFAISMIWSYNIKRVGFGTLTDRVCYSLGAAVGSVCGLLSSKFLLELIQN